MPTVYHHPLTSSVDANTLFNSSNPAEYITSAQKSIYTIVSDNIFIGGPLTQTITFSCNNFKDIIFKEDGCSTSETPRALTLEELYNITNIIDVKDGKLTFDIPVYFNNTITVDGDATFNGYVYVKDPSYIKFTDLDLNLEQWIAGNNWTFSGDINFTGEYVKFTGPNTIYVDENITLENYVKQKISELSKLKIIICYDGNLPDPETADNGALYLVPNDIVSPSWYTEYIIIGDEGSKHFEKIGTTDTDLTGVIKKDENNTLPSYTNPEYAEYSGKPGIMFDGKFYWFEILEYDPQNPNPWDKLDDRYVKKLPECNEMEPYGQEIGLCFNGNFYSFESLCVKQHIGPNFEADDEPIEIIEQGTEVVTIPDGKTSIRITPINNDSDRNYIVLDAICIDQNAKTWMEIDYIDREPAADGKMGVYMTIYPLVPKPDPAPDLTAWLSIKTMNTINGEVFDSQIFFRSNENIHIPAYHPRNKFKYKVNDDTSYTNLQENNLVINIETGTEKLYITHDCFILLDVHLVSENGLTEINGFSNNEIVLNVDATKTGTDWLAIKCLNDVDGVVFYRSVKILK